MALALALRVRTQIFKKNRRRESRKIQKIGYECIFEVKIEAFLNFSCGKFKFSIWVLVLRVPRHHSQIPECLSAILGTRTHLTECFHFFTRTRTQNNWVPKNFSTSHSCPRTRTRTRECECHFALLALALAHLWRLYVNIFDFILRVLSNTIRAKNREALR